MRTTLSVVLLFLFALSAHASDPTRDRDGNWWRGLTLSEKQVYIVGFFDGIPLGHKFSSWNLMHNPQKQNCLQDTVGSFVNYVSKYLENVTSGQLTDGLDDFYSDYRNRSIPIDNAVWLVANSISGKPQAELDKMIESFRRNVSPPK